jgi:hypothetical protein
MRTSEQGTGPAEYAPPIAADFKNAIIQSSFTLNFTAFGLIAQAISNVYT